jgi:hypothetical protein
VAGKTSRDCCPNCKTKFYIGDLPTIADLDRFRRSGVVNLGTPAEQVTCPQCSTRLKVSIVKMGTFYTVLE